MGWGSKKAKAEAAAPQPARTEAAVAIEVMEPEEPAEKPTDAARAQLAWHKFKSSKGYTDATVAMLLYEFIASRALFAELVKFAGRKK